MIQGALQGHKYRMTVKPIANPCRDNLELEFVQIIRSK